MFCYMPVTIYLTMQNDFVFLYPRRGYNVSVRSLQGSEKVVFDPIYIFLIVMLTLDESI